MEIKGNPIARAYELARTGDYALASDIGKQLKREGYDGVDLHLASGSLRRELAGIARAAGAVSKNSLRWAIKRRAGM